MDSRDAQSQRQPRAAGDDLVNRLKQLEDVVFKGKSKKLSKNKSEEIPSEYFKKVVEQAEKDRKSGKASPLFTENEELIKKNPKKYHHVDTMQDWLKDQGI